MKVLQVINSLQVGGAEVLVTNLIPKFRRLGIYTDLYVLMKSGSFLEDQVAEQSINIFISKRGSPYSFTNVLELHYHLSQHKYDIVHSHLFPAQLWVPLASIGLFQRPLLVTTEHSTTNRRRKPWFYMMDEWMYRQYDCIVCISEATVSSLLDWQPTLKSNQDKLRVIHNGVPLEWFKDASPVSRESIIGTTQSPVALFVARFDKQKDHATVIRAVHEVPGIHLVLVGDGPLRSNVEHLVQELGIRERVHFLGRRSDIPGLIKMADVYIHSAHWEGFGLSVVEAMAGGLPILASRVPGLEQVVGDAGLLFRPGDHQELAALLRFVLSHGDIRAELARKARQRSMAFSLDRTARQYVALYKEIVTSS